MRFHKDNVAAVLIDVQERLTPHIFEHENIVARIEILLQGLKYLNIPQIVTEQYVKGLGSTVPELAKHIAGIDRVEKMSFSCTGTDAFMDQLLKSDKKEILLFGIETHVCVLQTCLDLINRGFHVIIAADCVSSRKQYDREIALERMRQEGARITTSESILFELCKVAGTDTFKAISKLVK